MESLNVKNCLKRSSNHNYNILRSFGSQGSVTRNGNRWSTKRHEFRIALKGTKPVLANRLIEPLKAF